MLKTAIKILLIALFGIFSSCQTYRNLDKIQPRSSSESIYDQLQKLDPGDRIRVTTINQETHIISYLSSDQKNLRGTKLKKNNGQEVNIPIDQIQTVEVKKFNWIVTAVVVPAVGFATFFVLYILAFGGAFS